VGVQAKADTEIVETVVVDVAVDVDTAVKVVVM